MGRALKAFVDNRKGIILKTWPYKADLKPMISQFYAWLIRFLVTHLPDLLRGCPSLAILVLETNSDASP